MIPKHKGDFSVITSLNEASLDQLKLNVWGLLEWMKDLNWPVSRPIAEKLRKHTPDILEELMAILLGSDEEWKYSCIAVFGIASSNPPLELRNKIIDMCKQPTKSEVEADINYIACEVIKTWN